MLCEVNEVADAGTLNPSNGTCAGLSRKDEQGQRTNSNPEPGAAQTVKALAFSRSIPPAHRQPMRSDQQHRIEMSVDRENTGEDVSPAITLRKIPQCCDQQSARQRRQQHKQRVTACLLRVANGVGMATYQRNRNQSHTPVK